MVGFHKDKYVDQLVSKAKELGIKDISENQLISNFMANYDFYATILEQSLSDGIISVDEKVELYKYRASIISDDLKLIKNDGKLSKKDSKILTEILKIVNRMRDDEQKYPSMV